MIKKLLIALAVTASSVAFAADPWPSRPIRIIIPYVVGGASDLVARTVGARLSIQLNTPVVVESKPGAANIIATDYVVKSAPDGYTLLLVGTPTYSAQVHLTKNLPYDVVRDLTPINNLVATPLVFSVNPSLPVKNVQEFITYAKANPNKLAFASVGSYNSLSLSTAIFRSKTGVELVDIPYKGSSQALIDLLSGNIQLMFDTVNVPIPHIQSGKLRPLATTGTQRAALLPNVPTLMEQGVDMSFGAMLGLMGPANMPKDVVNRLNAELTKVMQTQEVRDIFAKSGMEPRTFNTADAYAEYFRKDVDTMGKLVRDANIKPE
ncbi:MAG: tripartite tricarboxylate transporter substrate binding protein [Comamonadaceae bacterium]|nr:MAG: tripartite tricarboxylate transporter substrate binding protein [Comamonadaceae bacterium]